MEKEIVGHIEIWVTKKGQCPAEVHGLTDFGTLNILSSVLSFINQKTSGKHLELTDEDKNALVGMIYQTLGSEDGFRIINALAWCINRVAARMAQDHRVETPGIVMPELIGMQ